MGGIVCGIYKITNPQNNKCYIGQSINIYQRWKNHISSAFNSNNKEYNIYFHNVLRKYGKDFFTWEIIEECNEEELDFKEQYWINFYKSNDRKFGYNITDGGFGGHKGECKKILQYDLSGVFLKEWDGIYYAAKELKINESSIRQCCCKNSKSAGGYQWKYKDDETPIKQYKKEINYAGLEQGRYRKGCVQFDLNGNFIQEFNSRSEAARWLKENKGEICASPVNIGKCCNKKIKTAYGYVWKNKEE